MSHLLTKLTNWHARAFEDSVQLDHKSSPVRVSGKLKRQCIFRWIAI